MILSFALAGMMLTGCGKSTQEAQPEAPEHTAQETQPDVNVNMDAEDETADNPAQPAEEYEDNFSVSREAVMEFAGKIKDAVADKDLEALAELTAFPVYVGLPDVGVVEAKEDFLKLGAEAVITEDLMESVEKADMENFQPCMAGFPVSDGRNASINFGVVEGVLAINGINY